MIIGDPFIQNNFSGYIPAQLNYDNFFKFKRKKKAETNSPGTDDQPEKKHLVRKLFPRTKPDESSRDEGTLKPKQKRHFGLFKKNHPNSPKEMNEATRNSVPPVPSKQMAEETEKVQTATVPKYNVKMAVKPAAQKAAATEETTTDAEKIRPEKESTDKPTSGDGKMVFGFLLIGVTVILLAAVITSSVKDQGSPPTQH